MITESQFMPPEYYSSMAFNPQEMLPESKTNQMVFMKEEEPIRIYKEKPKNEISFMDFSSFDKAMKTAGMLCKARCIPKEFWDNPADALVVIQFGSEIGLSPMVSLQNVMIVNNRPSVYGEALLAICMGARGFIDVIETYDEKTQTAWCTMKRERRTDVTRKFSRAMAETAGYWGKRGASGAPTPWVTAPERMLQHRARGFAAKDMFPDALKGISIAEEMRDITYYENEQPSKKIGNTPDSMKERLKNKANPEPMLFSQAKDVS